jgi:hypothetical protein
MRSICMKGSATIVAVLALCAIASASAFATPQWYVNGKALTGSATISQTMKVEEKIEFSFYSGGKLEKTIVCTGLTGGGRPFEITAPTTLKIGDFLFEGCKGTITESKEACGVGGGSGELGTAAVAALFSTGTSPEDHAEFAREGKSKVWSEFALSGCIIEGLEFQIDGTLPVKLPHGQTATTEQELVLEKAPGLYNYGEKSEPIYITGKVKLKLTSGSAWALH